MKPLRAHWQLDPDVTFLNHGSFGATPTSVLQAQQDLRQELEREPVQFLVHKAPKLLDATREKLAGLLHTSPDNLVWVNNTTTGVNTVLRSLPLTPGDEILVTSQGYNACSNAARFVASRRQAKIVMADVPFPVQSPQSVIEAILAAVTPNTKYALLDHVTSGTALVFPIDKLVAKLKELGIETIVDGAHAPAMVDVHLDDLGAAYYIGNCHKWLCAPKGAAFLFVRQDLQQQVHPLVISHGSNTRRPGRSLFHDEFDWTGTDDPTAFLCVADAIDFLTDVLPGGLDEVRTRNHKLAMEAGKLLSSKCNLQVPAPEAMIGSMIAFSLPTLTDDDSTTPIQSEAVDPLQAALFARYKIEIPVFPWPRAMRISAHLYNSLEDYEKLAAALQEIL